MSNKRRNHSQVLSQSPSYRNQGADETSNELSQRFGVNTKVVVKWKKQLLDSSSELFASGKGLAPDRKSEIKALQSKIGEITMANDFLSNALGR